MAEKKALRRHYRGLRGALGADFVASASRDMLALLLALPEFARAGCVFIYVAMPGEPETRPAIEALWRLGKRVCVPRCAEGGRMDLVHITGFADLAASGYGIDEPRPGLPELRPDDVDFAVLPALACGLDGTRLGQGGGYYDRFLADYRGEHAALCFEAFVAPTLPREPHDRPVQRLVTERRVIAL